MQRVAGMRVLWETVIHTDVTPEQLAAARTWFEAMVVQQIPTLSATAMAAACGVSRAHASAWKSQSRTGARVKAHPRHFAALARIANLAPPADLAWLTAAQPTASHDRPAL
jgi:hypothetical protein